MRINLNKCVIGQKLVSKHGMVLTYLGKNKGNHTKLWPHMVKYPDGGTGSRTTDGFVYTNPKSRLPADHDIVTIIPLDAASPKTMKFSLTLDVEIDPRGVAEVELKSYLYNMVTTAIENGTLLGNSAATMEHYTLSVRRIHQKKIS